MFSELVGKTLLSAALRPDGEMLTFMTTEGAYVYVAEAECCSESWVESMSADSRVIDHALVRYVWEKKVEREGSRQEWDRIDFVTIVTNKGYWDLEFRNSSNGFYGGNMTLISPP